VNRIRGVVRIILSLAGTVLAAVLLAWVSAAPLPFNRSDLGRLRLSWTARPERIERCRTLSEEEVAKLPEHMRRRVECEGRFASYALRVEVDGEVIGDAVVRGGGFRHDRPIFLLREYPVSPGTHRVRLTFNRRETVEERVENQDSLPSVAADTGLYGGRTQRELAERVRRRQAAIPPRLELDTTMTIGRRGVALVTWDAERAVFELRADPRRSE
jgi:hypothetical protein